MKITLTFDNGPTPETTPQVLDALAAHSVRATFFLVADRLRDPAARELAARAASAGHWIGNHTLTHTVQFGDAPGDPELVAREIADAQHLIGDLAAGTPELLFRPYAGGGILDRRVFGSAALDHLRRHEYTCVLWNSLPHDWDDPEGWVDRLLADAAAPDSRDWSLVVLHDLPTGAMDHLPRLLDELSRRGADLVQDFPPSCLPLRPGHPDLPLAHLTAD
ncbi:polysaccharide deacetylase family protein [Phaeacidiphilus oryzae]|uniref:polysaccharide deacetylase family protein n=1 Tax=Phaeacidiphilus oryzae TaxID=348818 RepID=UPI0005661FAE|nr:polysaccharide deacetylase family protein [Phaeacidiphilus oryzae]